MRELLLPKQPVTPAIMSDPHMQPKVVHGLVQVMVLRNMTYLDHKFHNVGAKVAVPKQEAADAVQAGYAQYEKLLPIEAD